MPGCIKYRLPSVSEQEDSTVSTGGELRLLLPAAARCRNGSKLNANHQLTGTWLSLICCSWLDAFSVETSSQVINKYCFNSAINAWKKLQTLHTCTCGYQLGLFVMLHHYCSLRQLCSPVTFLMNIFTVYINTFIVLDG